MKKIITSVILAALLAGLNTISAQDKYQGLLWEISGNGSQGKSYLYGTMHVSHKIAFHLSDTFYLALQNVDVVALEINPDSWFENMYNSPMMGMLNSGGHMGGGYGRGFYGSAFRVEMPDNDMLAASLARDPSAINNLLYRFSMQLEDFEENTFLDLHIFQVGKKLNKQIASLEDFDRMMERMMKSMVPDDEGEGQVARQYRRGKDGKSLNQRLEEAYRQRDLDMIDSLMRTFHGGNSNHIKYIIDVRNEEMAQTIDSIIQSGKSVFAGAGAAHLPGSPGIIELLREMGYVLRPVEHTSSGKTRKFQKKIEETRYPISNLVQYPLDSTFTFTAPGKLLASPSMWNTSSSNYLFPDMANGSFYSLIRINHYGSLFNYTQQDLLLKIDSLLYENTPGDILERQHTTISGMPGIRVVNKTRRGDYQEYAILVTPYEYLIFKASGTSTYLQKEKKAREFVSSINIALSNAGQWTKFTSPSGGFSLDLPGTPVQSRTEEGYIRQLQTRDNDGNYYLVQKITYPDYRYIEEDTFELNVLTEAFYEELDYTLDSREVTTFNGFPALVSRLKNDLGNHLHIKTIIKGPDYYLLAAQSNSERPPDRFFESFAFSQPTYARTPDIFADSAMHFSVSTYTDHTDEKKFQDYLSYLMGMEKKKNQDFESKYLTKTFTIEATGESIFVSFLKNHFYKHSSDPDKYENFLVKRMAEDNTFIVRHRQRADRDSLLRLELVVGDTASSRAIRALFILKNSVLYSIYTNGDTSGSYSPFVDTFFATFTPADTGLGTSYFVDKNRQFLLDLKEGDSAAVSRAVHSINSFNYTYDSSHVELLMATIEKNKVNELQEKDVEELKVRTRLIHDLGEVEDPAIVPFLKDLYIKAGDTATLQFAILEALALQHSRQATSVFLEMLMSETPLSSKSSDISDIFRPFQDSLELAVGLYPQLLELVSLPEYQGEVYELLANLVSEDLMSTSAFANHKSTLLRTAKNELKRHKAAQETTSGTRNIYSTVYREERAVGKLNNYATVLTAFYSDPEVQTFYEKLKAASNEYMQLQLALSLARNGIDVNDTLWAWLTAKDRFRSTVYASLRKWEKLGAIDTSLFDQENLARGFMAKNHNYQDNDTIVYLSRQPLQLKDKAAYAYFYKVKKGTEPKYGNPQSWTLHYVLLEIEDSTSLVADHLLVGKKSIYDEEEIPKEIAEILSSLRYYGRQRARLSQRYDDYGSY